MGSRLFGKGYSSILMLSLSLLIAFVFYPHTVLAGERLIRANPFTLTLNTLGQGTVTLDPPGGSYSEGTRVTVTATPDAGWIFFAFGGEFPSLDNPYTLTMNTDSWIDPIFILDIPESASIELLPGDTVADYRIVSAPLMMPDNLQTVLADMIGTYDTTLMRIAAWDDDLQQIEEYPIITTDDDLEIWGPGGAGWFLYRYGKTLYFEGYKTPELDGPIMDKMGFLYELGNNWNMLGNPYNYPINVSSLIIKTRSSVKLLTGDQTLTQGVFWMYQNGTYVSANNAVLQPGEGGWIKVLAPNSEDPELFFPSGQALRSVGNRAVIDTTGLERPPAPPGAAFSSGGTNNASEAGGCFISTMD